MLSNFNGIDHVVLNARDRVDEAVQRFQRLGFQITPRGFHTLGSINHLIVFGADYLELLGFEAGKPSPRTELVANPIGLIACALATSDAKAVFDDLTAQKVPVREPMDFSRPVTLPNGNSRDASFRVTRLESGAVAGAVLTFCQHFTPQLVWRPEWQQHPNGAQSMLGALSVVPDPHGAAAGYARILGEDTVRRDIDGASVKLGHFTLELVTAGVLRERFGEFAPDRAGREAYMAVLRLQSEALEKTRSCFRDRGAAYRDDTESLLVPASAAMGAALQFHSR